MGEVILSVGELRKTIGRKEIIKGVSFDVRAGEIFGFLGPNGSGKTTTIRMLVDLIKPTSGTVTLAGKDVQRSPDKALREVGCIVENPELYPFLTGYENLEHFAGMLEGVGKERIREVADIVGLDARIHDKVKTYSLGMRQRLGIAQALLGRPKLLILDEPTNGLDPQGIKELRLFIRQLADEGMGVFVSSHLLSEIQLMCDRVAIILNGRVIAVGEVDELLEQRTLQVGWTVGQPRQTLEILAKFPQVQLSAGPHEEGMEQSWTRHADGETQPVTVWAQLKDPGVLPEINAKLIAEGIELHAAMPKQPTLEDLFLALTEGNRIE